MEQLVDIIPGHDASTRIEVWKSTEGDAVHVELRLAVQAGELGWQTQRRLELGLGQARMLRSALGVVGAVADSAVAVAPVASDEVVVDFEQARRRLARAPQRGDAARSNATG